MYAANPSRKRRFASGLRKNPTTKTSAQIPRTAAPMILPNSSSLRCSGVGSSGSLPSSAAILPSSVSVPVATAIPAPRPYVTVDPENAQFTRSPTRADGSTTTLTRFPIGADSPVSDDSSIRRWDDLLRRRSAGTTAPVSSRTTSPGTTSRAAISTALPSLRTRALGAASFFNDSSAASARASWRAPTPALRRTMARMTPASIQSPNAIERATAPRRIRTITPRSWASRRRQNGVSGAFGSSLAPYSVSRSAACFEANPASGSTSSCPAASSIETA